MNIAAAMAAIRLDDVPGADKLALLVLAARAGRDVWSVTRSLPALAGDMGVSEATAQRAVARLRRRGYLQVVHRLGTTSTYTLGPPLKMTGVTPVNMQGVPPSDCDSTHVNMTPLRRKAGERLEGGARPRPVPAAGAVVENAAGTWQPNGRPHPPGCECGGTGWLDPDDHGEVMKCKG